MRTHGIIDPNFDDEVALERFDPSPEIADFADRFWTVRWNVAQPREQETLPFPCINVVVGMHRPGIHGPATKRFVAHMQGSGWVLGLKFKPASFRVFSDRPMGQLVGADLPLASMFGTLEQDLLASDDRIGLFTRFFAERAGPDPEARFLDPLVATIETDRSITRVGDVAARAKLPVRTLERMFRRWIGVTPKWIITRFRVHEAAARVTAGEALDWSALANELGYYDQAHFIREYKAQVGRTPHQHAELSRRRPPASA